MPAISDYNKFWIILSFCAFWLGSSISEIPQQTSSHGDRIAGFVPYSDASAYYSQMLIGPSPTFDEWNSRRPWNSVINIFEFHLTHRSLLGFQLLRALVAALAISCFLAAVAGCVGWTAALLPGLILLFWAYPYASSCLSEINGISAASAGTGFFLLAIRKKNLTFLFLAIFCCGLAYELRSYNPFWVLMVSMSASFLCLQNSKYFWFRFGSLIIVTVMFLGLLNFIPRTFFAAPSGASNYGYAILGLTRGTDWKEASEYIHQENPFVSGKKLHQAMLATASENIRKDAVPTLRAMGVSAARSLFLSQQEFSRAFGFPQHLTGRKSISANEFVVYIKQHPSIWVSSCLFLFSAVSVCLQSSSPPVRLVAAVSLFSLFSVAPIVFTDGGFRSAASLYPGLSLIVLGLPLYLKEKAKNLSRIPINEDKIKKHLKKEIQIKNTTCDITVKTTGLLISTFYTVALPFTWSLKYLHLKPTNGIELKIIDQSPAKWTGWNQAQCSQKQLIDWCYKEDKKLGDIFHKNKIYSIEYLSCGAIYLNLKIPVLTEKEIDLLSSKFKLQNKK